MKPGQQDEMPSAKRKRILDASDGFTEPKEYVLAIDYDALRAHCERLAVELKLLRAAAPPIDLDEKIRALEEAVRQHFQSAESAESRLAALREEAAQIVERNLPTAVHTADAIRALGRSPCTFDPSPIDAAKAFLGRKR